MNLDEPLSVIAPLAAELAAQHCRHDEDSGETCAWYHGTLDYLRLLGVMSSPAEDRGFLVPAFERLAREPGFRRVFVSGAGDCAMLTQVLAGFAAAGATPAVTLIDRCETPVRLNRWFAKRQGLAIEASRVDILDYAGDTPFDILCTHCFLGFFPPEARPGLFAKWFSLLRPGGCVITVNPVRDTPDHSFLGFSAAQAAAFRERALAAVAENPGLYPGDLTELQERVALFTTRFGSYPVRSKEEFTGLFEDAGFVVESCGPLNAAAGGGGAPGVPGPAYHAAVARRP